VGRVKTLITIYNFGFSFSFLFLKVNLALTLESNTLIYSSRVKLG
jgi:hypothetical protein